jgi:hypothetical protein
MIKDYKRVELGEINNTTRYSTKTGDYVTTSIIINELPVGDEKLSKEIKWTSKVKFNYTSYWKQNWRKFLPK